MQKFIDQNKRFPSEEEQMQIAAGLLKESKSSVWETIFGGTRAFEVPSTWVDPRDGKSYDKDQWKQKFKDRLNREPTPKDLFQLYQKATGNGQ